LGPTNIRLSKNNPKAVIIVDPTIDPRELETNVQIGSADNQSVIATWNKSVINPYGSLASIFRATRLFPYQWIKIKKFRRGWGNYTIAEIEITARYNYLSPAYLNLRIVPSRFFWDLEVYSSTGQFPEAGNDQDEIFMGSGSHRSVDQKMDYLFHLKKLNKIEASQDTPPTVVEVKTEADLIHQMITIHRSLHVDRSYTYNGYNFDSPYLAERSKKLDLSFPASGKLIKTKRNFRRIVFQGLFGRNYTQEIFLPGVEQLDLALYIKKFHPGLQNNKLGTVGMKFLGVGKTGLSIPELNQFYRTGDPEGLKIGGEYSLQDSILLAELQEKLQIDQKIEELANVAGITTEQVLKLSDQEIVNHLLFQLDPGLYFLQGNAGDSPYLSLAKPGLYHPNVYIYDYSPLYVRAMIESKNSLNLKIAIGLFGAYPSLIYKIFYSKVLDRNFIDQLLNRYLIEIDSETIFARTEYLISSMAPLKFTGDEIYQPKLVEKHRGYLSITKTNYITMDSENNLTRYGTSDICKPPYPLAEKVVTQYLEYFFGIGPALGDIQIGPNIPIEQLVLNDRIKDKSLYPKTNFRKILAEQYGDQISTWITVDWVQTDQGPILLSHFQKKSSPPAPMIDYSWYGNRLNDILHKIAALPRILYLSQD
jgi:DNA polymerase elongation subunit (family B)